MKQSIYKRLLTLFLAIVLLLQGVGTVFAKDGLNTNTGSGSGSGSGNYGYSDGLWGCKENGGCGYRIYPVVAPPKTEMDVPGAKIPFTYEKYHYYFRELALYELDGTNLDAYENYHAFTSQNGASPTPIKNMIIGSDGKFDFSQVMPEPVKNLPKQGFANNAFAHNKWDEPLNGDDYETGVVHTMKKGDNEINVHEILEKYIKYLESIKSKLSPNAREQLEGLKDDTHYGKDDYEEYCMAVGICFEPVGFTKSYGKASISGQTQIVASYTDLKKSTIGDDAGYVWKGFLAGGEGALATWQAKVLATKAVITPTEKSNLVFLMYNLDSGNAFGQGMTIAIRSTKDWSASSSGTEVEYDYSADTTAYSSKSPKIDSIIGNESVTSKLKNIYADNSIVSSAGNYPMYMLNKKSSSQEDLDKLAGTKGAARTGTDGKNKVKEASKYFNGVDTSGETRYAISGFLGADYKKLKSDIEENDLYLLKYDTIRLPLKNDLKTYDYAAFYKTGIESSLKTVLSNVRVKTKMTPIVGNQVYGSKYTALFTYNNEETGKKDKQRLYF